MSRLRSQIMHAILGSTTNIIREDFYDNFMNTAIFTLIMNEVIHMSSKDYEANGYMHNLNFLIISH